MLRRGLGPERGDKRSDASGFGAVFQLRGWVLTLPSQVVLGGLALGSLPSMCTDAARKEAPGWAFPFQHLSWASKASHTGHVRRGDRCARARRTGFCELKEVELNPTGQGWSRTSLDGVSVSMLQKAILRKATVLPCQRASKKRRLGLEKSSCCLKQ